ncbi:MAG: hypothetical protein L6R40_001050 [Gallowayella cf. fulva]|nr:MAG: hypothetical protein L6R40_001050 [Xanthomendoza cf. fulva]
MSLSSPMTAFSDMRSQRIWHLLFHRPPANRCRESLPGDCDMIGFNPLLLLLLPITHIIGHQLTPSTSPKASFFPRHININPLLNHYPIPKKPFTLDFDDRPTSLPRSNVRACLSQAYSSLQQAIDDFGRDTLLPAIPNKFYTSFDNVQFVIGRTLIPPRLPEDYRLTYGDTALILEAIWDHMLEQRGSSYSECRVWVRWTSRRGVERGVVGTAKVWRK